MTDTPITHPLSPTEREKCDELLDHIYEYTILSEGVCKRIDAFVAAVRKAEADRQAAELARLRAEVEALRGDLRYAEAALADIGDADREPGDDLAWCERRAAKALPRVRAAIDAARTPEGRSDG